MKQPDDNQTLELFKFDEPSPVGEGTREVEHGPPTRRVSRVGPLLGLGALLLLVGAVGYGAWRHYQADAAVMATAEQIRDFVPSVLTAAVHASPGVVSVSLPGTTAAWDDANIYARATGYIVKRKVDIGDHVKQGELLAQLAVPEIYDQISQNEGTLAQLRASLQQAEANLRLAQVTWDRDRPLVHQGWATQQQGTVDVETQKAQEAAVGVARSNVAAQENLLRQLHQDVDYASVVAPFDGVVTQRLVDVGSLVQGNVTGGTFMFEMQKTDVIRVWAYVPQDEAFGVAPGVDAIVRVPELPGREFAGKVTRIADALQPGTRTLLTEVDVPNPDGGLPAGIYCTVELKIPRKAPSLIVPAAAIVFNAEGLNVVVVEDGVAHIHKVTEVRDFGATVEVSVGVKDGDQVILNPPVDLTEGHKVKVLPAPASQLS